MHVCHTITSTEPSEQGDKIKHIQSIHKATFSGLSYGHDLITKDHFDCILFLFPVYSQTVSRANSTRFRRNEEKDRDKLDLNGHLQIGKTCIVQKKQESPRQVGMPLRSPTL